MANSGGRYFVDEDGVKVKLAPGEPYPNKSKLDPVVELDTSTDDEDED